MKSLVLSSLLVTLMMTMFVVVEAQQCVRFRSNFTQHFCERYVDYDYYLPDGPTEWTGFSFVS